MSIQPNFFESVTSGSGLIETPPIRKKARRLQAAEAVHDKEDELWRQMFRKFVISYAQTHDKFTPEAVRHAYTEAKLPNPKNWRSSGQLFKKLAQEGYLKIVGMSEAKDYGCPTRLYSKGEKRETAQFNSRGK